MQEKQISIIQEAQEVIDKKYVRFQSILLLNSQHSSYFWDIVLFCNQNFSAVFPIPEIRLIKLSSPVSYYSCKIFFINLGKLLLFC